MNEKRIMHIWKIMANLDINNDLFKWWIFLPLAPALTLPRLGTAPRFGREINTHPNPPPPSLPLPHCRCLNKDFIFQTFCIFQVSMFIVLAAAVHGMFYFSAPVLNLSKNSLHLEGAREMINTQCVTITVNGKHVISLKYSNYFYVL